MWLLQLPGVYRPQADTWLLTRALREARVRACWSTRVRNHVDRARPVQVGAVGAVGRPAAEMAGPSAGAGDSADFPRSAPFANRLSVPARALDLCTGTGAVAAAGTGAVAVAAARLGAREVDAVDTSRRAVWSAHLNGRLRRVPVHARRGDVLAETGLARFDLVLANPPYVPCEPGNRTRGRAGRAWDAGSDGPRFVDLLCDVAPSLLTRRGTMLIVHSSLCGIDRTLTALRDSALKASIVARHFEPFGPVLGSRIGYLEEAGLIDAGQRHEELVVIRADHTEHSR